MKRFPNGVEGDFFHQKRVPPHPDYVDEKFVRFPSGHTTVFAVVDNAAALAWVVNLGCIELHTWHSRVDDIERPDYLLIDLDPSEGNPWELRSGDRAGREGGDGRPGARVVSEDLGCDGAAHPRADPAGARVPGGAAIREGARGGGRAASRRPGRRDDDVARGRPERRLRRLRPERARPDDRLRLLRAADPGRTRVDPAAVGRGRALRPVALHGADDAEAARRRSATSRPGCGGARRACCPRFEQLGLPPGDSSIGEPKPRSSSRRWTGDGRARSR